MKKENIYVRLRKIGRKENWTREINELREESGLSYRTLRGLVSLVTQEEIPAKVLDVILDKDFYEDDDKMVLLHNMGFNELIPAETYEHLRFLKEAKIDSLPPNFVAGDDKIRTITTICDIKHIGDNAFKGCSSLRRIEFESKIETIGDNAFEGCKRLSYIELPDTLTYLGKEAFLNCTYLEQVELGKKLTTINDRTFKNCNCLTEIYSPVKRIALGDEVFKNCYALENIPGKSISSLGKEAFESCEFLECVELDCSIIPAGAFAGCRQLKKVVMNNPVVSIGDNAFLSCSNLKDIRFDKNQISTLSIEGYNDLERMTGEIFDDAINYSVTKLMDVII